jgi:hypothetical protein
LRGKQEINNNMNYISDFILVENTNNDDINSNKNNLIITSYKKNNKSYFNKKNIANNVKHNISPQTYYKFYQKFKSRKPKEKKNSKSYNNIKNNIKDNINVESSKKFNLLLPNFQKEKSNEKNNKQIEQNNELNSYSINIKENKNNSHDKINNMNKSTTYNLKHSLNNYLSYSLKKKSSGNNLATIGFLPEKIDFNYLKRKTNVKKRGIGNEKKSFKAIYLLKNNNDIVTKKKCPLCHKNVEKYRYRFHLNLHPSQVLDWLYLGSYRDACNIEGLKELGINYVLNCAIECLDTFPFDIKYCHLKINDIPSFYITSYFEKATSFINQAHLNNGIILVHCQLGISRSISCVIAYFIKYLGYTAMDALSFIKRKRSQVMPNYGFLKQLINYEKDNLDSAGK